MNQLFVFSLVIIWTIVVVFPDKVENVHPESSASICLVNKKQVLSSACPKQPLQSQITCNEGQRIMINDTKVYISVSTRNSCNSRCNGYIQGWYGDSKVEYNNMKNFIYQHCSFKRTCDLSNSVYTPASLLEKTWFIDMNYTCISKDDVVDICSPMERNVTDELHLVTGLEAYKTCSCVISGNARVTIPQYTPCHYDLCTMNNVSLNGNYPFSCWRSCESITFTSYSEKPGPVNIVVTGVNSMMFFWLAVSNTGNGVPTVVCTNSQHSTDMSTSSSDDLRDNTSEDPQDEPFPTGAVIGGVTVSVIAIAVVVVILILCIRRQKKRKQLTDDDPHYHSPQFQSNSAALVTGNRGKSNMACIGSDNIIAATSGSAQAHNVKGNHSISSEAGNEYSTIDQTEDSIGSSEHEYAAVDDDNGLLTIGKSTAKFSKVNQSERRRKSGQNDLDSTYTEPYNESGGGSTDVGRVVTDSDPYSHLNRSDNFSVSQGQDNYSHINVAQSSESTGYYSHTNVTNGKQKSQHNDTVTVTDNFDNYSHVIAQQGDTYSHLALPVSLTKTGQLVCPSSDVYNHITIPATEHGSPNTLVIGEKSANVEDTEYDTCART